MLFYIIHIAILHFHFMYEESKDEILNDLPQGQKIGSDVFWLLTPGLVLFF